MGMDMRRRMLRHASAPTNRPARKTNRTRLAVQAVVVAAGAWVSAVGLAARQTGHWLPFPERPLARAAAPAGARASAAQSLALDTYHGPVRKWIDRLTHGGNTEFIRALSRRSTYADMIVAKLDRRAMPHELMYLAMIESEFNPYAKSDAKAVGLWQFMSGTARQLGLTVNRKVDERTDPARATDAALSHLAALHDQFGSWYLAAAAYNAGDAVVARALKRKFGRTTGSDEDFFRILPSLPRETQEYVPKLIATAAVASAPERYGVEVPATPMIRSGKAVPVTAAANPSPKAKPAPSVRTPTPRSKPRAGHSRSR